MYNKHQKNQKALRRKNEGEAHQFSARGNELNIASYQLDSLPGSDKFMEEVCEKENLIQALKKVKQNKGAPGIDGMTVDSLELYLKKNWLRIKEQLLKGEYKPLPVKRIEIPKLGKGVRKLGIPSVIDRFIQQAILQPLQKRIDPTLFGIFIWIPSWKISTSSNNPSSNLYRRGLSLRSRHRPGAIL